MREFVVREGMAQKVKGFPFSQLHPSGPADDFKVVKDVRIAPLWQKMVFGAFGRSQDAQEGL